MLVGGRKKNVPLWLALDCNKGLRDTVSSGTFFWMRELRLRAPVK